MADETTPRLNLVKPEVGGSADTWGDKWNENADKIDAAIIKPDEENVWSAPQHFDGGLYDGGERVVRQSDVMTSPTDTTEGRLLTVGAFGLGGRNDLRNTIYVTGAPKDLYGKGYVIGFADGSQLSPPIGGTNNYGTLEVKFHWTDSSGRRACSRTFTTEDRVFVQRAVNDDTWGPWRELTPIGVGQTWQTVTGSRAANTIYTNTTGRPIFVAVTAVTYGPERSVSLEVDDTYMNQFTFSSDGSAHRITVSGLVPPGSTYRVVASSGESLGWWRELR